MDNNILEILKEIFAEVLLCPVAELNLDRPYVDMGVDSILAIQISKLINMKLNTNLQPSDLYNFTSIKSLTSFFEGKTEQKKIIQQAPEREGNNMKTEIDSSEDEKIAVIGMAGSFPGANDVDMFWKNMRDKISSISTSCRWGKSKYRGGFLENIEIFDADLFHLSPKEAILIDPQQRLLLQTAWQAFEDAGYTKTSLSGAKCGVFATSLPGDYRYLLQKESQAYNPFSFTGNAASVLAGRISHFFNLKGPCIYIDTACSSSLVCIDQAVKSLQAGECDIAFVGASSVFSTPEIFNLAESSGILSKSGNCYSFDERADGFVPAETVAGLVLTKLSLAKQMNRQVYGLIEAISTSHDGFTNGIMSPNGKSQKELLNSIYKKNHISPEKIAYIEAHGTGTGIGDPLEVNALGEALKENSQSQFNSFLGTCKANIGHALVASGLIGVIKVLKAMQHSEIPPQINFNRMNPQIREFPLSVNTDLKVWPQEKPLACVSSFGFGGTNSHLVIKKYEETLKFQTTQNPLLFVFSAHSTLSLKSFVEEMILFLDELDQNLMTSLSYTLCCLRELQNVRFVVIAKTKEELKSHLKNFLLKNVSPIINSKDLENDVYQIGQTISEGKATTCEFLFDGHKSNIHLPPYKFDGKAYWVDSSHLHHIPEQENQDDRLPVLEVLKLKLSEILGYKISDIEDNAPIKSFGIDSLVALQLLEPFKVMPDEVSDHAPLYIDFDVSF